MTTVYSKNRRLLSTPSDMNFIDRSCSEFPAQQDSLTNTDIIGPKISLLYQAFEHFKHETLITSRFGGFGSQFDPKFAFEHESFLKDLQCQFENSVSDAIQVIL